MQIPICFHLLLFVDYELLLTMDIKWLEQGLEVNISLIDTVYDILMMKFPE